MSEANGTFRGRLPPAGCRPAAFFAAVVRQGDSWANWAAFAHEMGNSRRQLPPRGVSTSGWIPFRIIKTKAKMVLNVRKVELYLGDLAQRMCPLIPSSKDFVHKVPHLSLDLARY